MVRRVAKLGMEVCCSLGMLDDTQAERLASAGLDRLHHNLDTSPSFTARSSRLAITMTDFAHSHPCEKAGITVVLRSGSWLGESENDRVGLLHQLLR